MFGLLKKTSWKIEGKALDFFRIVFSQLPADFQFLADGLDNGLYRRFYVNHSMKEHFYFIGFDPSQSDKSMIKGKHFELGNILIKQAGQAFPLNITVHEGLWIGFEFEKTFWTSLTFKLTYPRLRKIKASLPQIQKLKNSLAG